MLVIRLSRSGAVKRPFYHVVATDSRKKRDGRYVERLGYYNPKATEKEASLQLDVERVKYWESHGAQLSPAVRKLVKRNEKQQAGKAEKVKPQAAAQAKPVKKKQPAKAKADAPKKEAKAAAGQKPEKKESAKAS